MIGNSSPAGFMICARSSDGQFTCMLCGAKLKISPFGVERLTEHLKLGKWLAVACTPCGGQAMKQVSDAIAANPDHPGASLEILPHAQDFIQALEPELLEDLKKRDAETRGKP
jgi:hypothetical protein